MTENVSQIMPQSNRLDRYEKLEGPSPPPISVNLALDTAVYSFSRSSDVPALSITMTSHFMYPITICTYGSLMEDRSGFMYNKTLSVMNTSTGLHLRFPSSTRCRRCPVTPCYADGDYYLTLFPGVPVTVTHRLVYVASWTKTDPPRESVSRRRDGTEFHRHFEPGHEYKIGLAYRLIYESLLKPPTTSPNQLVFWWRYGAKEDILIPRGTPAKEEAPWCWSEPRILIGGVPDVTLKVEE